ncbi:MAG: hypothetical protein ACE14V_14960 [bacterium]
MTKLEIIQEIDSLIPNKFDEQERTHLNSYLGKSFLEIILSVLKRKHLLGISFREWFTLDDKAKAIVYKLKPYLEGYSEYKALDELSNTTHGVLNKLKDGFNNL